MRMHLLQSGFPYVESMCISSAILLSSMVTPCSSVKGHSSLQSSIYVVFGTCLVIGWHSPQFPPSGTLYLLIFTTFLPRLSFAVNSENYLFQSTYGTYCLPACFNLHLWTLQGDSFRVQFYCINFVHENCRLCKTASVEMPRLYRLNLIDVWLVFLYVCRWSR